MLFLSLAGDSGCCCCVLVVLVLIVGVVEYERERGDFKKSYVTG